jgi:hypothetical protein
VAGPWARKAGLVTLPPLPVDVAALARRFWSKVDKGGDCWVWTASLDRKGYGQIAITANGSKRPRGAHRVAWELTHGPIPSGLCVCHRCDNPRCVRPDHLFLGTVGDNNRDMWRKGRGNPNGFTPSSRALALERLPRGDNHYSRKNPERVLRGERNGNAILTPDIVRALRQRRASGESLRVLAAEYGVSEPTVSAIATRRLWRHVS